jgi:hypothetical protein
MTLKKFSSSTLNANSKTSTANLSIVPIEYLIVGSGANGGYDDGVGATAGGGGAGGYIYNASGYVSRGESFTVTVGAKPSTPTPGSGFVGGSSSFGNILAFPGGAGQYYSATSSPAQYWPPKRGGSGGGGGYTAGGVQSNRIGASGTPGQGNPGGDGIPNNNAPYTGGGGGGAGGAGQNAPSNGTGGAGGAGLSNSITGTAVIYAAGGGGAVGGVTNGTAGGAGGSGGVGGVGGNGNNQPAGNGAANTGSGGGGRMAQGSSGGEGSAGVVIIAYTDNYPALSSIGGGLTYTQPTRAGYRVYRFTAGTGTITF